MLWVKAYCRTSRVLSRRRVFAFNKILPVNDLASYYENLAAWEAKPSASLVAQWEIDDVNSISEDFRTAFPRGGFHGLPLSVVAGTSNQSIGNKVAEFLVYNIQQHLERFRIEPCSGPGYPDKRLVRISDGRAFVFELKATSQFDPRDSNRIVLTSSSEKIRKCFQNPINHLLGTACYDLEETEICIKKLRLDFLEPSTPVNVRLEASVSQRILSRGTHKSFDFEAHA